MICPSCNKRKVDSIKDHENNGFEYSLCLKCEDRLVNTSLRPLEYYRLKAFYGNTYLLHDDFYDEDGKAAQPQRSLGIFNKLSFPKLKELKTLKDLIDFATVAWGIDDDLISKINIFSNEEIEKELISRLDKRPILKYDIVRITSKVIKNTSSEFVKTLWTNRNQEDSIIEYAELLANTFKDEEGVLAYLAELDKITTERQLNEDVRGLMYFQSSKIIDWIEYSSDRINNIPDIWGTVSALSNINWATIKKWIQDGRPLSLMAIDALSEYATDSTTLNRSSLSRERINGLPFPPESKEILDNLNDYLQSDGVARVKQRINHIKENIDKITRKKVTNKGYT